MPVLYVMFCRCSGYFDRTDGEQNDIFYGRFTPGGGRPGERFSVLDFRPYGRRERIGADGGIVRLFGGAGPVHKHGHCTISC